MVKNLFSLLMRGVAAAVVCLQTVCMAQDAAALNWFRSEAQMGAASVWCRWAVDPAVANSAAAELTFVTDGHCSLYVNGQRILQHVALQKSGGNVAALGFDVKSLLRQGRNTVAVEVHSVDKVALFGIAISAVQGDQKSAIGGVWRMGSSVPPVGWQQTDFNDRDWLEAKPVAAEPGARFTVAAPEKFAAPVLPAKIRTAPFEFEDGDHVVFVGATFFERAQLSEHLEATLASTCGEKHVTFRNLGWSADTVFADSRGIFDKPDVGYLRMVEHIRAEEPTVAFICYGQNEALTAGMTPELYSQQLSHLLAELAASGIACVLVSPHELLPALPPLPSPSRFNPKIKVFAEATANVADSRGVLFVNLFTDFSQRMLEIDAELKTRQKLSLGQPDSGGDRESAASDVYQALSENGVHLTDHGYACAALILRERLLGPTANSQTDQNPQYESLRQLILTKNELYFHRWRPQNITYLFGFRKHEQGNNAADIAKFDPFIQELETQIYENQ